MARGRCPGPQSSAGTWRPERLEPSLGLSPSSPPGVVWATPLPQSPPSPPSVTSPAPLPPQSQGCISADSGQGHGGPRMGLPVVSDRATAATVPAGLRVSLSVGQSLCHGDFPAGVVHLVPSAAPASRPAEPGHSPFPEAQVGSQGQMCCSCRGGFTGGGEGGLFPHGCPAADLGTARALITLAPCSRGRQMPSQTPGPHQPLPDQGPQSARG